MGTSIDLTGQGVIAQIRTHKLVWHRDDITRHRHASREVASTFLIRVPLDDADFATIDPTAAWAEPVAQAGAWADAVIAECVRIGYTPTVSKGKVVLGVTDRFPDSSNQHILYQYEGALEVLPQDGDVTQVVWSELTAAARRASAG